MSTLLRTNSPIAGKEYPVFVLINLMEHNEFILLDVYLYLPENGGAGGVNREARCTV